MTFLEILKKHRNNAKERLIYVCVKLNGECNGALVKVGLICNTFD